MVLAQAHPIKNLKNFHCEDIHMLRIFLKFIIVPLPLKYTLVSLSFIYRDIQI